MHNIILFIVAWELLIWVFKSLRKTWQEMLISIGFTKKSWSVIHPYQSFIYTVLVIIISVFLVIYIFRLIKNKNKSIKRVVAPSVVKPVQQIYECYKCSRGVDLNEYEFEEYEDNGYVKIFIPVLKHRVIAERILNRNLYENEVVHHVDGNSMNNDPSNLCVMDSVRHEQFHAWLRWKKQKSGFYPHLEIIRRELEGDVYRGIILG